MSDDEQAIRDLIGSWHLELFGIVMKPKDGKSPQRRTGNVLSVMRKQSDGAWLMFRDGQLADPIQNLLPVGRERSTN